MAQIEKTPESTSEMVKLKNGSETKRIDVPSTFLLVEQLMEHDFYAFHELVSACRNSAHTVDPESRQILIATTLVIQFETDTGLARITDHTRNVVLSMIQGNCLRLGIVNPIAD